MCGYEHVAVHFNAKALLEAIDFRRLISVHATFRVTEKVFAQVESFAERGERLFDNLFVTKNFQAVIELSLSTTAGHGRSATERVD